MGKTMRSLPSMECLGRYFILKELFCAKNVFLLFFKLWKVNITWNALMKNATFYYPSELYLNVTHEKCTNPHPLHLFQFAKCGDLKIRCRFPFIGNDLKCWLDSTAISSVQSHFWCGGGFQVTNAAKYIREYLW